jgi:hypothetical protein
LIDTKNEELFFKPLIPRYTVNPGLDLNSFSSS